MTDESPENEESADEPIGGARLRMVRRENDISVRDIAKELHLDEAKVRALEKNDFAQLGAPVFAKGHMRKYAELVGIADDDILDDYYQLNRSAGAPPVVGPKRRPPVDYSFLPALIAGAILALLVSAALYWWFNRDVPEEMAGGIAPATLAPFAAESPGSEPQSEELLPQSSEEPGGDAAAEQDDAETAAQTNEESTSNDIVDAGEIADESSIVEEEQIVSNQPQVSVTMTFSGDCWTEASDASDRRLFYDLGSAGRVVTISGDAPLRIVFGDGDNVRLQVEGRDYPIPASARSGRLARLTIQRP